MILPNAIQKGATVALISPASAVKEERLSLCEEAVRCLGYTPVLGRFCHKQKNGYLAGTAIERAHDVNTAFRDPNIQAIFCLRGGYGASDVLPYLDYEAIRQNPKIFIGYSDISCILMALMKKSNLVTFHGPMISSNLVDQWQEDTIQGFCEVVTMSLSEYKNPGNQPLTVLAKGRAEGEIIGGNLSVICNVAGTPYEVDYDGKLLFLEDIYESVPRIHRMLTQMVQRGIFQKVNGILLGDFADCTNAGDPTYTIHHLLSDFFQRAKIPVMSGLLCGHCNPTGTLPIGMRAIMDTESKTIRYQRG